MSKPPKLHKRILYRIDMHLRGPLYVRNLEKVLRAAKQRHVLQVNTATDLAIHGLKTDGSNHKQWALEQVLIALRSKAWMERQREQRGWTEGIAP